MKGVDDNGEKNRGKEKEIREKERRRIGEIREMNG